MPYIDPKLREPLDLGTIVPGTAGELNYVVTTAVWNWIKLHGLNYSTLNAAIGALECAKLELYRRKAAPYEDKKITENGDVYV